MNKAEIKQIILEEIEAAINDMASNLDNRDLVDPLATILSIPDNDEEEYARDWKDEQDALFGPPMGTTLEEARKSETWKATPKMDALLQHFVGKTGVEGLTDAMARISQVLTRTQNVGFKSRAKKYQKRFFTDEEGNVDTNKLREFAELILNPEGFSQKDIQMFVGLKNSAQANAFKMKLYRAKLIDVIQTETGDDDEISESKKN